MLPSSNPAASRPLLLGAGTVVVLLAVLATLQYRWLGQVSEADQARLHTSAQNRADEFARDFDREVTRAFLRLRLDAASARALDGRAFLERRARWKTVAAYPGLVKDVWLANVTAREVWHFDPEDGSLAPEPWPASLFGVRDRLQELVAESTSRPSAPGASPGPPPRPGWRGFDFIDERALALVSPIPDFERGEARPGSAFNPTSRFAGYTVVTLDRDTIREQLLPALARRHFGLDEEAEFAALVTSREDPRTVLFRSSPKHALPGPGDATAHLLGIRMEEANEDDLMPRPGPSPRARAEGRSFGMARRGGGPRGEHEGHWRLVATHREGSVDHVVAAARMRNLAVSGLILALLGVSVVLIVISAQRARRLADRQLEFVAGVSHELRTPVAVIASAGENLADGLVTDQDTVRQYGRMVREEARRLVEMVEQVLDFAGSYGGRRAYRFDTVEVAEVAQECVAATRPALEEARGTLIVQVDPDLPQVKADRAALRRAVLNLLQNAVKYGGDGPRVTLRVRNVPSARGSEVEITVEDGGLGITPAEKGHLFEPFFRGEEARSRQIRGSGLGLSLVKRIVDAHSGRIRVTSAPGEGSAFTLVLPAVSDPSRRATSVHEEAHDAPHTAH